MADIAVTESLSNVVLEADINHSALRNVKTLSEFKGQLIFILSPYLNYLPCMTSYE